MKLLLIFILCGTALVSQTDRARALTPETNLGTAGNTYVAFRFSQYQAQGPTCAAPKKGMRRVLLSAFGPFGGKLENPSGSILAHFGNFPIQATDVDVYGTTRDVQVNGVRLQICFLITSTLWDLSAAILTAEMDHFQPDFFLMTGLGTERLLFETGDSNQAEFSGGFDLRGKPAQDNTPQEHYVLPPNDPTVPSISHFTWNAPGAQAAVDADVAKLGFSTFVPLPGYPENNYICNNVGFAVTHAALNLPTVLAGGALRLQTNLISSRTLGFIHYPVKIQTDVGSLNSWTEILKKVIVVEI